MSLQSTFDIYRSGEIFVKILLDHNQASVLNYTHGVQKALPDFILQTKSVSVFLVDYFFSPQVHSRIHLSEFWKLL